MVRLTTEAKAGKHPGWRSWRHNRDSTGGGASHDGRADNRADEKTRCAQRELP
jgi:hypothetical protein